MLAPLEDLQLVESLRRHDEAAFVALVDRYSSSLTRLALTFVQTSAVADDVVQETWLAVLEGIDRFESRASVKTWIFSILANIARTRAVREARMLPFSSLAAERDGEAVDADRFVPEGQPWAGHWESAPRSWARLPEERLAARETMSKVAAAIVALPASQREVITLRDVEGWGPEEVCNVLQISETNQRVLLHRARTKVRRALDEYLHGE